MLCGPSRNVCHSEGGLIRTSVTLPSSRRFLTLNFSSYILGNQGFPASPAGKKSTCNAEDPSLIPGSGRSYGEGYPLQYSCTSLVAQLVKNPPAMQETWVQSLRWEDPWRREQLPTPLFWPGEFHELYSP